MTDIPADALNPIWTGSLSILLTSNSANCFPTGIMLPCSRGVGLDVVVSLLPDVGRGNKRMSFTHALNSSR
jgi:hypothetical protein